jgi:Flp pilus assembly pilin Flp
MWQWIRAIRREELAQDLIEYTLLIGFVTLVAIGLFIGSGASVQGIWSSSGSTLVTASSAASDTSSSTSPSHGDHGGDHGDGDHGGDGH